jgi:hypothetical protein
MKEFIAFNKIARLRRDCVITEKIDGTNAQIYIGEDGEFLVGSRTRWITPDSDNYGFARWATDHKEELMKLGPGAHFGEWWGLGIQRGYGMKEKVFSLFNSARWTAETLPSCCRVVPILYSGVFTSTACDEAIQKLKEGGSIAAPGFMQPEGIVLYQVAGKIYFKQTIDKDDEWKGKSK